MKSIRVASLLIVLAVALTLTSCGPSYVGVNSGYGRPYYNYGYGYRPYTYYRPYGYYRRPPVVVAPRPRYYNAPRVYNSPRSYNPGARSGYGGSYGGNRSRGPR